MRLLVIVMLLLFGCNANVPVAPVEEAEMYYEVENIVVSEKTGEICCMQCVKGKACGDACINRKYKCTVGDGCACDETHFGDEN